MRILLLGGTADARSLADLLTQRGYDVIYSIAGLVRTPKLTCDILIGGFSQFGGLTCYLQQQQNLAPISLILDATHPYAQRMSNQAVFSAQEHAIPCWRFHRPKWIAESEDNWVTYRTHTDLLEKLTHIQDANVLLLTAGQFSEEALHSLEALPFKKIVLRTAVAPSFSLTPFTKTQWLKAIGPFSQENEEALMKQHQVSCVVSKNSGGNATFAKLIVARNLALTVFMCERPTLEPAEREFIDIEECIGAIEQKALTVDRANLGFGV